MRDYVYVWNDRAERRLVSSGIHLADVPPHLTDRAEAHDDGWYLALHYRDWREADDLLARVLLPDVHAAIAADLRDGLCGYWIAGDTISRAPMTDDIDAMMNVRIRRR
jgi:hypothetical protein